MDPPEHWNSGMAPRSCMTASARCGHGEVLSMDPRDWRETYEESGEVIAMIDSVITELDMEMTEAETEEKLAQEEYKELMATEEYVNQLHAEYEWIVQ